MNRKLLIIITLVAMVSITIILAGCSGKTDPNTTNKESPGSAQETPESKAADYMRSAVGGSVSMDALWYAPDYIEGIGNTNKLIPPGTTLFTLSLTTHSGSLLDYDLGGETVLIVDGSEIPSSNWEWTSQDPHHPEANIWFPWDGKGIPTLLIRDLRGEDIRISWQGGD